MTNPRKQPATKLKMPTTIYSSSDYILPIIVIILLLAIFITVFSLNSEQQDAQINNLTAKVNTLVSLENARDTQVIFSNGTILSFDSFSTSGQGAIYDNITINQTGHLFYQITDVSPYTLPSNIYFVIAEGKCNDQLADILYLKNSTSSSYLNGNLSLNQGEYCFILRGSGTDYWTISMAQKWDQIQ